MSRVELDSKLCFTDTPSFASRRSPKFPKRVDQRRSGEKVASLPAVSLPRLLTEPRTTEVPASATPEPTTQHSREDDPQVPLMPSSSLIVYDSYARERLPPVFVQSARNPEAEPG